MEEKKEMKNVAEARIKEKQKRPKRKGTKAMKFLWIAILIIGAALMVILFMFTPERMIIGTWEYDFEESYMFYYGEKVEMGWPLYGTLSFANETQMATGGTYYINREELGIKPFGQGNYTRFEVSSITPNKLILIEGDPLMGTSYTYNVYRKK